MPPAAIRNSKKKRLFNGRKERFVVGRPTDTSRFALSWHDKFSLVRISVTEKKPTKEKMNNNIPLDIGYLCMNKEFSDCSLKMLVEKNNNKRLRSNDSMEEV